MLDGVVHLDPSGAELANGGLAVYLCLAADFGCAVHNEDGIGAICMPHSESLCCAECACLQVTGLQVHAAVPGFHALHSLHDTTKHGDSAFGLEIIGLDAGVDGLFLYEFVVFIVDIHEFPAIENKVAFLVDNFAHVGGHAGLGAIVQLHPEGVPAVLFFALQSNGGGVGVIFVADGGTAQSDDDTVAALDLELDVGIGTQLVKVDDALACGDGGHSLYCRGVSLAFATFTFGVATVNNGCVFNRRCVFNNGGIAAFFLLFFLLFNGGSNDERQVNRFDGVGVDDEAHGAFAQGVHRGAGGNDGGVDDAFIHNDGGVLVCTETDTGAGGCALGIDGGPGGVLVGVFTLCEPDGAVVAHELHALGFAHGANLALVLARFVLVDGAIYFILAQQAQETGVAVDTPGGGVTGGLQGYHSRAALTTAGGATASVVPDSVGVFHAEEILRHGVVVQHYAASVEGVNFTDDGVAVIIGKEVGRLQGEGAVFVALHVVETAIGIPGEGYAEADLHVFVHVLFIPQSVELEEYDIVVKGAGLFGGEQAHIAETIHGDVESVLLGKGNIPVIV